MRLIILIICLSSFGIKPVDSYSQNTKLSLNVDNTSIKEVLLEIEKNSEFFFLYNNNLVDVERKVDLKVKKKKIKHILDLIFDKNDIVITLKDKQIVLSPKVKQAVSTSHSAQNQLTGLITDEFDIPLAGVSIVIKGTNKGVMTDFDGKFSIDAKPEDTLVISYIGMGTQEILVGTQTTITVRMKGDEIGLDEIVLIGYGTAKKRDLTGAVASYDVEKLEEIPNVSVIQALQGTVAGLNVGAVNAAGADPTISVRGQTSLTSGAAANAPLIVVDGIIYRGNLVDLNKSDIESIDILKDASSAAIYGSQAANGVLLITTKKGKVIGKPVINYSASYTVQTPTGNALEPMESDELKEFLADAYPGQDVLANLETEEMKEGYASGFNNGMWDIITGDGYINTHNLSIRGKSEDFGYFFSGGFTDVKGFIINDTYKRVNYRMNLDAKINDWLSVGTEAFVTSSDYSGEAPRSGTAALVHPWTPLYEEDGSPRQILQGTWFNPLLDLETQDDDKRLNLFANIHMDVKLPIDGLNYRVNFSQNYRTANRNNFDPYDSNFTGVGFKNSSIVYNWTLDHILTYNKTFNDIHNVNATLVYGVEEVNTSFTNASAQNFVNDLLGYDSLEAGDPTLNTINTGREKETSLYTMGRLQYGYDNKYLITGTIRRDGFSGFGSNEKIGIFPSVAVGWVLSEENFMDGSSDWLNYLKFRGSYGSTGRRAVGRYDTQAIVGAGPSYIFGDGNSATIGQQIVSLAKNNLGWETTTGLNVGVDFAFLKSRLRGNIEYYDNSTKDVLYPIQIPYATGFTNVNTNIGEVANHGLEISLTGQIIKNQDFKWEASVNFTRNRNEVVSILGADNDEDGIEDDLVANRLFIGEPTGVIYDYEIIGMWQEADAAAGNIPNGFFPGTYKIADLDESGDFSANFDRKILGYTDPSYRLGIANTFTYKQFSLYTFINTVQGGKDFYYGTDSLIFGVQNTSADRYDVQNIPKGAWDYWTPDNPNARFRRLEGPLTAVPEPNRYLQRNFVRIQDVSLTYSFKGNMLDRLGFSNMKLFISGKNLATFTKWRGWDPETGQGFTWGSTTAQARPVMANYTLGINVEF
ncbi:TonB-dependent receptor [Flavivirga aquimarina]|uniref:TonB-dependent receptor n=1 Tax=Flavivirga aquimarina TaxID=2027862 RepID=A0ABT8W8Z6_9FLAO|nr:TonB-dependent receptor [Flavivirga aquimarina]MDO5969532.1 TonB-dependent receptor [Flavivirga aquimarina]